MAVVRDLLTYFNPRTKRGRIRLAMLVVVCIVGLRFIISASSNDTTEPVVQTPTVAVGTISDISGASDFKLIGTVKAVDQARIQSEASGRIVAVNVALGEQVAAGTVIAQLENASQRAALLQAEGAYEAAQAAAATSDISTESALTAQLNAKRAAITATQNAYTTVSGVLYNTVDTIYANPQAAIPGVRIDGGSQTSTLNSTRVGLQSTLPAWQTEVSTLTTDSNLAAALATAESNTRTVLGLVDTIIAVLSNDPDEYAGTEFASLRSTLLGERSTLLATLATLDNTSTSLEQANDAVRQAQLGGTNGDVSAANAAVKQALGSLRAAQANYNKTIITTPIAGVVNTLEVDAGDFISVQTPIATVANNNALEITTFVGERDRARISVGQSVLVDGTEPGVISNIAPAINPTTGKIEVKIQSESESLQNGDTVNLTITSIIDGDEAVENNQPMLVPLTAVKFTARDGFMFTVEDGQLVANQVELGPVSGSYVEIISGIDASTEFVFDARGLTEGFKVEAVRE